LQDKLYRIYYFIKLYLFLFISLLSIFLLFAFSITLAIIVSSCFCFSFAFFFACFLLQSLFFNNNITFLLIKFNFATLLIDLAKEFDNISIDFLLDLLLYLIAISICTLFFWLLLIERQSYKASKTLLVY